MENDKKNANKYLQELDYDMAMRFDTIEESQGYSPFQQAQMQPEDVEIKESSLVLFHGQCNKVMSMASQDSSALQRQDKSQEIELEEYGIQRRDSMLTRTLSKEVPTPQTSVKNFIPQNQQSGRSSKTSVSQIQKKETNRIGNVVLIAVSNILKHFVPPETRLLTHKKWKVLILEIAVGIIVTAGLIFMFIYYGQCSKVSVISTSQRGNNCKPILIAKKDTFIIDSIGSWESSPSFVPYKAYFRIRLFGYENTDDGFINDVNYIKNLTNTHLDLLSDQPWIRILQGMMYNNISVKGLRGHITIQPYFDVLSLFHRFSSFKDSFYNLRDLLQNSSPDQLPFTLSLQDSLRVQKSQCGFDAWRRYNETDPQSRWQTSKYEHFGISPEFAIYIPANMNGSLFFLSADCGDDSNVVSMSGQEQLIQQVSLLISDDSNKTQNRQQLYDPRSVFSWIPEMVIEQSDFQVSEIAVVHWDGEAMYQQMAEVRWDMYQVLGIDFCNSNIDLCRQQYGKRNHDSEHGMELFLPYTGSRFPLVWLKSSSHQGAYGYYWASNENLWGYQQDYVVVPQISQLDGCVGCNNSCNNCDYYCQLDAKCKLQMLLFLHFYYIQNLTGKRQSYSEYFSLSEDQVNYVASYSLQIESTGFMNQNLAEFVHCCTDNIKFKNDAFANSEIPFATSTGFYSCSINQCKYFLERMADAFATSELLFAVITVLLVTLSMVVVWFVYGEDNTDNQKTFEREVSSNDNKYKSIQQNVQRGAKVIWKSCVDYFDLMLPQEGKKAIFRNIRLILGMLLFAGLMLAFVYQYLMFGRCETNYVISAVDQSGSSSICTERQIHVWEQIVLDGNGKYETDPQFEPRKAYWILELTNYSSNDQGFLEDVQNLFIMLNSNLQTLNQYDHIVATEKLLFTPIEVLNNNGKIALKPNLDLYPLNLAGYETFYDLANEIKDGNLQERIQAIQLFCNDAWFPAQGNAHYVNQGPLNMFRFIYRDSLQGGYTSRIFNPANGEKCDPNMKERNIPQIRPFTLYPAMLRSSGGLQNAKEFQIGLEAKLVFQIDYYNRFWNQSGKGCNQEWKQPDNGNQAFQVGCSENLKWGFIGSTEQNFYAPEVWYFIVPELSPVAECSNCSDAQNYQEMCNRWHILQLHYYYIQTTDEGARLFQGVNPEEYIGTYGSIQITTSTWNRQFSSFGKLYCGVQELLLPDNLQSIIEVPFELSTGLFECEIKTCKSIWERAAESFANTEFLFVFLFHVLLVTFVIVASSKGMDTEITKENKLDYAIYLSEFQGANSRTLTDGRQLEKNFSILKRRVTRATENDSSFTFVRSFWRVLQIPARVVQIPVPRVAYETCGPIFRAFIGVAIACILLTVFFIFFFGVYSECKEFEAISTDPSASSFNCRSRPVKVSNEFPIDTLGHWEVDPNYNAARGLWKLKLNDYKNDVEGFKKNISTIQQKLISKLDVLQRRNYIDVIQDLVFSNLEVQGQNGTMQLVPNIDISYLFAPVTLNNVHSFYYFQDILHNKTAMLHAIKTCGYYMARTERSRIRVTGQYLYISVTFRTDLDLLRISYFWPTQACNYSLSIAASAMNPLHLWSSSSLVDYETSYGIKLNYWEIVVDLNQAFLLDFCNKNVTRCAEKFKLDLPPCGQLGEDVELRSQTSLKQQAVYRPGLCAFGYLYNVSNNVYSQFLQQQQELSEQVRFFVKPEFLPHERCLNSCYNNTVKGYLCGHQRIYELFLHHYLDGYPNNNQTYHQTLYIGVRSNGGWNAINAFGKVHCNIDDLYFSYNLSKIDIPYDLSLDLYDCQIKECKSQPERLANSFANVENLFILITLFLFLTLTCLLNWRSSIDHM